MGKIDYFEIELKKPVYHGGETLSGVIHIQVKERFKTNSISLSVVGSGHVSWREKRGTGKQRSYHTYSSREVYMDKTVQLIIHNELLEEHYMEASIHAIPFEIKLPDGLPSSFKHEFGKISYSVKSNIDISRSLFDKHAQQSFRVIASKDLNKSFSDLRRPMKNAGKKVVGFGPFKSEPIVGTIRIGKSGYVPGESINFECHIDNPIRGRTIKEMTVSLNQLITFIAGGKSKNHVETVARVVYSTRVGKGERDHRWKAQLIVPPVVSSNEYGSLIQIEYNLKFNFNPSGLALSRDVLLRIVIGTVPFHDRNENSNNELVTPSAPLSSSAMFQLPPPSYEPSMMNEKY